MAVQVSWGCHDNDHRLRLETLGLTDFPSVEPESKIEVLPGCTPSQGSGGPPASLASGAPGGPGFVAASVHSLPHLPVAPPLSIRTLAIGFRATCVIEGGLISRSST